MNTWIYTWQQSIKKVELYLWPVVSRATVLPTSHMDPVMFPTASDKGAVVTCKWIEPSHHCSTSHNCFPRLFWSKEGGCSYLIFGKANALSNFFNSSRQELSLLYLPIQCQAPRAIDTCLQRWFYAWRSSAGTSQRLNGHKEQYSFTLSANYLFWAGLATLRRH